MKKIVAESRDQEKAKEGLRVWLQKNPEIAKNLKPTDIVLEVVRVKGGSLFRCQVNLPSN